MGLLHAISFIFGSRTSAGKLRIQALGAIKNHERRYQVTVPGALKAFYKSNFKPYHRQYLRAEFSNCQPVASVQLSLTPPSWLSKDDDAINGLRGEWKAAKYYLPIFVVEEMHYLVVDLRTPDCQVGWYEEAEFNNEGDGFRDGVLQTGMSLSQLLASLTKSSNAGPDEEVFEAEEDPDMDDWYYEDYFNDGPRAFDAA